MQDFVFSAAALRILPAVPDHASGKFTLLARGGFLVSAAKSEEIMPNGKKRTIPRRLSELLMSEPGIVYFLS